MPYLTLTKNLKLQLNPGLVASYDIQPGNGVGLFWDKHTHMFTHLLTCPGPTRGGKVLATKAFLVYFEPKKRVWWQQF